MSLLIAILMSACAPARPVKPYANHIQAGIEPGDRVELVTMDGRELEFVVTRVTAATISGDAVEVAMADIARISKRGWAQPEQPCGAGIAVGCSVPLELIVASDFHAEYAKRFENICAEHDFCYRHGFATYGFDRETCDAMFAAAMRAECAPDWSLAGVWKVESVADCELAAEQMYTAVRRFGEKHFRTSTSTYCEYDGPP